MNRVKVLFFASFKDMTGTNAIEFELADVTHVREFKQLLGERFPSLSVAVHTALVSVNRTYAFDDDLIPSEAEIAIFPPVSGGKLPMIG